MTCDVCGKEYGPYVIVFSGRIELRGATLTIQKGDGELKGGSANACRKCAEKSITGQICGGSLKAETSS